MTLISRLTAAFAVVLALFALPAAEAEAQDNTVPLFDREAPPLWSFVSRPLFRNVRLSAEGRRALDWVTLGCRKERGFPAFNFSLAVKWVDTRDDEDQRWGRGQAVSIAYSLIFDDDRSPIHQERFWAARSAAEAYTVGVDLDWVRAFRDASVFIAQTLEIPSRRVYARFPLQGHENIVQQLIDECSATER